MKIAVTYDNEQIFQHFGHTEQFKIYDIENDKIISKTVVSTNGQGHGALSSFLKENNVFKSIFNNLAKAGKIVTSGKLIPFSHL